MPVARYPEGFARMRNAGGLGAKAIAFSHGGTESTEEMVVFSSEYSVFSVALCAYLFEHAKRRAGDSLCGAASPFW